MFYYNNVRSFFLFACFIYVFCFIMMSFLLKNNNLFVVFE